MKAHHRILTPFPAAIITINLPHNQYLQSNIPLPPSNPLEPLTRSNPLLVTHIRQHRSDGTIQPQRAIHQNVILATVAVRENATDEGEDGGDFRRDVVDVDECDVQVPAA